MSGLEDLYREIILDHYRSPRNKGELETPPAMRTEGFNPLCGDEVVVYVDVSDGKVNDIKIGGQGCSISQASASMMTAAVKGKSLEEAKRTIAAFKALMMVHETNVGGDGSEAEFDGDVEEVAEVDLGDLEALQGVVKFPTRIKCATLSWNTLTQAFEDASV
jgi:nitrogen fixation NifU-like protein